MANNRSTYQQMYTVSIPKDQLLNRVARNDSLDEMDLRVVLCLFTILYGYNKDIKRPSTVNDPMNFNSVSAERISDILDTKKKYIKESIRKLLEEGIIEDGTSNGSTKGYRFTF